MMSILKTVVLSAVTLCGISFSAFAQDDLDALLKDLEGESAQATPAAEKAKEPAAEEAKAEALPEAEEAKVEEKTEVPQAEEPAAEEPKVEEKTEVPQAEEPAAAEEPQAEESAAEEAPAAPIADEPKATTQTSAKPSEPAKPSSDVDAVLNLLDELAAETTEKPTAPAAAEPKAKEVASKPSSLSPQPSSRPAHPEAELIENLRTTEKLRRTALDAQAMREIKDARLCMENKEYDAAVRHYGLAMKLLNDRAASKDLRKECSQGVAEGLYRAAMQEDDLGRRDRAQKLMEKALDMRHPKARNVLERWHIEASRTEEKVDETEIKHRLNETDYKLSREQIRKHLRRSRQYLAIRDMKRALEECEIVLVNDPYNTDAIRIRSAIQKKRKVTLAQEREAARDGMIADVDEKWRPAYAVNAARLNEASAETVKKQTADDPERTMEQDIEERMKAMRLPTISFKPPATIIDAVEFFRGASKDYDRPDIPIEKRGFNFVLKTPQGALTQQAGGDEESSDDFASNDSGAEAAPANGLPPIPTITASDITFYEALKLVCDSVDYKFIVRGPVVMVMQKDMSTAEILSRKYNVPEAFMERVSSASEEMKTMGGFGSSTTRATADDGEENQERDWKAFFEEMGVKWPEGSSIKHIKALGKLYVRNTRENLAEFEKVLDELGGQPQLIEIETRFVEVSQEDLNSLGFEWILNSDYSLGLNDKLGRALGIRNGAWGKTNGSTTIDSSSSSGTTSGGSSTTVGGIVVPGGTVSSSTSSSSSSSTSTSGSQTFYANSQGASWTKGPGGDRNLGINAFGGTTDYSNGNRYLSTVGNHISGESASTNDQFMRVNAFLGEADLSMILHMLSQRSDTDLLSAPKVVTKSGENAVIKVVTEYIYPQDYDVQLQSSSSSGSGGSSSSSSQSAILAIVEPQNFMTREVGVILDVTPTYSEANGGTIDLELKPSVVDEPIWKNYGVRVPFTGNTSSGTINLPDLPGLINSILAIPNEGMSPDEKGDLARSVASAATESVKNLSQSASATMTWYDVPMEQPFFHVRSIDSKVSITPGATVVMGGLITEVRSAMDDKVPFLGDLPYIGRLFRSHAEKTNKRNLLIFVTGRLITPSGRELALNEESVEDAEVKPAPKAE